MIPKKYDAHEYDYPDFQPDQVLSADHLNHSFAFNEQQERLTRTNLIGIGIICGLKASRSADGKTVTISRGTGLTSHGYLIVHGKENSQEAVTYKKYRSFSADILRDIKYDEVLVSAGAAKYPIWELLDANEAKATDPDLTDAFLSDKVCLLFYEMLAADAKNCDTSSCDDKGRTISITIRKLLVKVTDADAIISQLNSKGQASGSGEVFPGIYLLPEIRLPRFDVSASDLVIASDIFKAYQKVFTKAFVESVGNALNAAYLIFKDYLKDSSNPFGDFNSKFAFLHNGSIDGNDLLHFQYYWDFFCDLIRAFNEWRLMALPLRAMCTPPEALFPRHLFLAYFGETEGIAKSKYRNYFIPSPILAHREQGFDEFKSLFQRIVRMISSRNFPLPIVGGTATADTNIRITPSLTGKYPLSARAIPCYYKPTEAAGKLLDVWDYAATKSGTQNQILSYKPAYATDDFVQNPLKYDLEPYNFFRIEGHIGKGYGPVLATIQKLVKDNRLPLDIVALELSDDASHTKIDKACAIGNIQLQYELLRDELKCCLKKNINYWGQLVVADKPAVAAEGGTFTLAPDLHISIPAKDTIVNVNTAAATIAEALKEVENKYRSVNPKVADELKKFSRSISRTEKSVSSDSPKAYLLKEAVPVFSAESIAGKYLDYQKTGDVSINTIPAPAATAFNKEVLTYYGLLIIDETQEILLLLDAEDALSFDLEKLEQHTEAVKKAYQSLEKLLSVYLKTQKTVAGMKAMLGESLHARVEAIAAAIPEILEKNANTIILLLLNPADSTSTDSLLTELRNATTNAARQQVIDTAFNKLDKDGMMIPAKKEINYVEDFVLRDIYNQLRNTGCKCSYEQLKTIRDLLKKEIDSLKEFNLFSNFVKKHPGIQHKAGVPPGGTFIIAYYRKGTVSEPQYEKFIKNLNDGVVVADFYLPYLCSSDCQPVNFNVFIPQPAVSLGLDKLEYCSEDAIKEYLFKTNPAGGKLSTSSEQKDSIKDNGDGTFSFLPQKVVIPAGSKEVAVAYTYTVGDQMQSVTVKVYAYPKVKILASQATDNPLKFNFSFDQPGILSAASWQFGDGAGAVGLSASHIYTKEGEYTVSALVQNGVCSFVPENVPVKPKDPEPVTIGLKISEICRNAEAVSFVVSPKGGTFTGEGFSESPASSGKFKFSPSNVAADGTPQKTVDFTYTPLAGSPETVSVTVYEQPEAVPNFGIIWGSSTEAQFLFANLKNATTIELDFHDGSQKVLYNVKGLTTFTSPAHLFPGTGPFKVSARLINGTCSFDFNPQEFSFDEGDETLKVCQPLSLPAENFVKLRELLLQSEIFIRLYTKERLDELSGFFEKLGKQLNQNPDVPLSFFGQNPLKVEWLSALPVDEEQTRALSIRLLAILADLISTISCLKEEDVNQGNIQTSGFLEAVIKKVFELQKLRDEDKSLAAPLSEDANDEIKRLESNGETEKKQVFSDLLRRVLEAIKAIS